uniref:Putative bromodomain and WD repeat-containing protein 3 isoform X1 n=1 Tax=Davidia involucrata TaxID=16924 RepID=A0A5B6ZS60_DAVIN
MNMKPLSFSIKANKKAQLADPESGPMEADVDIDLREVYFLIMHFLSAGPCHRTYGQFWNELLEHQLLPRRYHAWYSRRGVHSGDENDDGLSFPLSYNKLVERYPHIEKDHLVKLLKQLVLSADAPSQGVIGGNALNAAAVPTLLGTGSFSLLAHDQNKENSEFKPPPAYMCWPHMRADQVHGLSLREIGGGFTRHHRAPSIRAACYAIAKPSTMVQKMQNIKKLRGHRNAVYCAIFDRSGRYVITGSDDRLVKIWSMETAYCLASCRGHEGDITDLAVSSNNTLVASASNDCIIRVWRLPDGLPISVLRGHTGAVTAIAFNPRPSSVYQLLSSSDDGTCRIWDARYSQFSPRIYVPRPPDTVAGKNNGPSSSTGQPSHQIFCCAFNSNGTVFVTGSSDTLARVWNACKSNTYDSEQPNHEMDVLAGHENDVNYVQFSGCAVACRFSMADASKEEKIPKFKNTRFTHDNIVTCSRDGSAIIWIPRSRRSHGKVGRWTRAYHLKVPPPPMPPQPPRGGPRQRILPTPRGVNMIVWSLDNRFVLAAIMDCRICVWNAVDGSLVHSLTGHSESTYVLDVHPFNPRIAMSAGYDGKTIVWDIWEGTPIRIYEIGRFKLVDGKFSPDGTSIILSDDVGQLYILNTGQGESQKDAKYDQFFLGDYRPLIQDTHGNVLDQETQLAPYRRNMQDLLCDSSMIPYPDPYQSMYQQRRLGALGVEWRPSSVRFAVGADMSLDQDFQPDLDILIDPLPEFIDAMDWEPENEVQSDDTDSEYNVTEYSSGGEQGSLSSNSSGDPECSAEDSEVENTHQDGLRRSKRKKQKAEVEIMTSSGRRVKRRNLEECDGNSLRNNRAGKSRNGRKASRMKSSLSKSLRPQRAAARSALTLFSRIRGTYTDGEDEYGLEGDSSDSESTQQDSNIETEESDGSLQNEQHKHSKGKEEVSLDEFEGVDKPRECSESHMNAGNRRRLVLKFPVRDLNKLLPPESKILRCDNQPELVGSSSKAPHETNEENRNYSQDPGSSSGDAKCTKIEGSEKGQPVKVEHHLDLLEGYSDGKIRWGGVKARTSKHLKLGEPLLSDAYVASSSFLGGGIKIENFCNGHPISEKECGKIFPSSETQNNGDQMDKMIQHFEAGTQGLDSERNVKEHSGFDEPKDYDESPKLGLRVVDDIITPSVPCNNGTENTLNLIENPRPISTKLRIRSKRISRDDESPSKLKNKSSVGDWRNGGYDILSESLSDTQQNLNPEVPDYDGIDGPSSDHGEQNGELKSEDQIDGSSRSVLQESQKLPSHNRMHNAVYRWSRSFRARSNLEGDSGGMEASTSNASNHNPDVGVDFLEATTDGVRRTRSMGLRATTCDNIKLREEHDGSEDTSTSVEKSSINRCNELPSEEWRSSSRIAVGLRSTRNRRGSYYIRDTSPPDRRKSHRSARNSWLMLSMHEEGSRYIPQQGDEVVYLRQGHQEYASYSSSKDAGPWKTIRGNIRAVEFCRVEGLEYSTRSGSGESCCKMTLQFVDPSSSVAGKSFTLILPEVTGFPDFLVERTRYDAAIQRNWTYRDKCQVWWKNEGDEDGSWWEGRILTVKPKSPEFPDSPWERYVVQYKSDPTETHQHSPWELYDADARWEQPCIDDEIREKMLQSFAKLELSGNKVQDNYGVQKLKQVLQRSNFVNRFPVPLSLEAIQSRLENNYYRSLEAMKHDIAVMLSNAESYFGRNAELSTKMKRLSDWFRRTLSSL